MINDQGRRARAQIVIFARRRVQPAQDGRADAPAGRAGPGAGDLGSLGNLDQRGGAEVPQQPRRCRSSSWRPAPAAGTIPRTSPNTMTLTADLPGRGAHLRDLHAERGQGPEGRRALARTTTFGKDSSRLRDRLGDKANAIIVREVSYEVTDATVDSQSSISPRPSQCLPQHHHTQVRRPGDPQGLRARLEAAAVHRQPRRLDRHRHAAGRHRGLQGYRLGGVREGPDRSAVQGRPRVRRLGGVDEEVLSRRQPRRPRRTSWATSRPRPWCRC